jgi:hypothetical protein
MSAIFRVARNPDADSRLPYLFSGNSAGDMSAGGERAVAKETFSSSFFATQRRTVDSASQSMTQRTRCPRLPAHEAATSRARAPVLRGTPPSAGHFDPPSHCPSTL